jgi:pyruvate/2-oxoglutarate dehydrogenase complex dihydrolipoamide acyltransferase (E2) component
LYQTTLADIETPEFTFGFQTEHEDVGILSEILVAEDVQVPVGTPICIVLHQPEDDPDLDPDLEPIDDYSDEAQAQRRERIAKKSAARKQGRDYEE